MDVKVIFLCISFNFLLIKSQHMQEKRVFAPSDLITSSKISNNSLKLALRYGFHQTYDCKDHDKAFICIQKCVDLHYDIAYADKYCFCTCYVKKEKVKYTPEYIVTKTKWKLGAPTTTKPAWVEKYKKLADKIKIGSSTEGTKNVNQDDLENEEKIMGNDTVVNDKEISQAANETVNIEASSNMTSKDTELDVSNSTVIDTGTEKLIGTENSIDSGNSMAHENSTGTDNPNGELNSGGSESATGITLAGEENSTGGDKSTDI